MTTTTVAAIKGRIGKTDYYQANISARELVAIAIPASELSDWDSWSMSERIQRDVSLNRIREELLPYLAFSKDRFYGSLIITVIEADTFKFEPLEKVSPTIPAAYQSEIGSIGFLIIDGGQLVALDGQHRLVGLRELITNPYFSSEIVKGAADDDVCVMFVQHESLESTRRIFNKVNRHARPTTPSDNIITSEDDGYAIIARWLTEMDPPPGVRTPRPPLNWLNRNGDPIVEWKRTTLTQNSPSLTTLTAVYKTVQSILIANGLPKFSDSINRPPDEELKKGYRWAARWWEAVLEEIAPLNWVRNRPEEIPSMRGPSKRHSLLFRPVGQMALFRGIGTAVDLGYNLEETIRRCNKIPWSTRSRLWREILVSEALRPITREKNIRLGGDLIGYLLAGHRMSPEDIYALQASCATEKGWLESSGQPPRPLPDPI